MKKLTNREITALAHSLSSEMREGIPQGLLSLFKTQVKKWEKSADAKILRKYEVKLEIEKITTPIVFEKKSYMLHSGYGPSKGYNDVKPLTYEEIGTTDKTLTGYVKLNSMSVQISQHALENAIVLEQIQCEDLATLITAIKKKFS